MQITKKTLLATISTIISTLSIFTSSAFSLEQSGKQDIEVGLVSWQRDFEKSLAKSKELKKPVLALFQEVPGCHGCQTFGKEVLSNKKLVKKIEDNFIPVLIYNNRGGKDSELLKRYKEPSWNYQVIRFLNSDGKDIIPRRDKVWSLAETNKRIDQALKVFQQKNTASLAADPAARGQLSQISNDTGANKAQSELSEVAFSQHCFWTGERKIGALDGVKKTEAGFYDGREVTRVWFDADKISAQTLGNKAKSFGVANKTYEVDKTFKSSYRKAPESDQKRQLRGTGIKTKDLNDFQATKVNAFIRSDRKKALQYLKN